MAAKLAPERPKHVLPRKPVMRLCKDGRIRPGVRQMTDLELCEWFWTMVTPAKNGCWEFCAGRQSEDSRKTGNYRYGRFSSRGQWWLAHVFSAMIITGTRPVLDVCHVCDNAPCVNPAHLFLGTAKDNIEDARRKGKLWYGERNHKSKLTDSDVKLIRSNNGESQSALARKLGVSSQTVSLVHLRKTWQHI